MDPAKLLDHVLNMDTEGILAVAILLIVFSGYKAADWWIKDRLAARIRESENARKRDRATALADGVATAMKESNLDLLGAMTTLHQQTTHEFVRDRAELAKSLAEVVDGREPDFTPDDRSVLHKIRNAHLGDGSRRPDSTLRWHGSQQVEEATLDTNRKVTKIADAVDRLEAKTA